MGDRVYIHKANIMESAEVKSAKKEAGSWRYEVSYNKKTEIFDEKDLEFDDAEEK